MARRDDDTEELREWCLTIVRFIDKLGGGELPAVGFEEPLAKATMTGLRVAARSAEEWARSLRQEDQEKLDGVLRQRFGRGLVEAAARNERDISKILKRGRINDEREFRILKEHIDVLVGCEDSDEKANEIDKLLFEFERGRAPDND